ncbi:MAG: T9SS type B sorting domain-containing protein [Cytophagaceae bacterium]|nr:T9SS type B sorting domain-containing protein [Cytophagaceae bacterium]
MLRRFLPFLVLVFNQFPGFAQSGYNLVGDARAVPNSDCYQLTNSRTWQLGAVWYAEPLRLAESFELEMTLNFGADGTGADGIVLVMQTVGNRAIGKAGGGIGFEGFLPSLGIELDTYRNLAFSDPDIDHIALVRNGASNHSDNANRAFASPVQMSTKVKNVKDGTNHRMLVKWNAAARQLDVFFDCDLRISQKIDLVQDVFGGVSEVFWGFTAATGGSTNTHTVCLNRNIVARDTFRVCQGERLTLVARESINETYQWNPVQDLENPTSRTPSLRADRDRFFTVSYRDKCFALRRDSVYVRVQTPPKLRLGGDRQVCEDKPIELVPTLTPAFGQTSYRWSTGDTTQRLKPLQSGRYALKVKAGVCQLSDSVQVTIHPLPTLETIPELECLRDQPLTLDARASGPGLRYQWLPGGSTSPSLIASTAGRYDVRIQTDFGCAANRSITVRDDCPPQVFIPDAFSPNGDGLNDQWEWKNTDELDSRLTVYDRWGEVLFSTENSQQRWDGTYQGLPCPTADYVFRLDFRLRRKPDGEWFVKRGRVTLFR